MTDQLEHEDLLYTAHVHQSTMVHAEVHLLGRCESIALMGD